MSSEGLHYDSGWKRKVIVYAEEHGNRAAWRTIDTSEANIHLWKNDQSVYFLVKQPQNALWDLKKEDTHR